jgi:hypothetical protein
MAASILYRVPVTDRFTVTCFLSRFSTVVFMVEDAEIEGWAGLPEIVAQVPTYAEATARCR